MATEPVVIVGAGPTGLMMALLLARQGIRSIVLERTRLEPRAPKAHVLNPRSLEIARAADLDVARMQACATSSEDDRWALYVTTMTGDEIGRSPFERQDDTHTPLPRINIAQPRLEQILIDAIAIKPCIELRIGHRWLSAEQSADEVVSRVVADDGSTYSLAAPYLLGADGAGSAVRKALGIELEGTEDVSRCLTIHFEADLRPFVADRPAMFYWVIGAPIPGIFIAYDIGSTWVYLSFSAPEQLPTHAELLELLRSTIGKDDVHLDVRHVIPWNLAGRVASSYRGGRIFLVGDACHSFPPSGGLGMNTGVQDAHNLAWKLAAVVHGWADPELLDTYETERRPVALRNTEQSLKNAGGIPAVSALTAQSSPADVQAAIDGMYDNFNSLAMQIGFTYGSGPQQPQISVYQPSARVGDRMPHAWIETTDRGRISSLDLLDDQRFTLLTRSAHQQWKLSDLRIPLVRVCIPEHWQVPEEWLETMDLAGDRGVLVRPDGHIESHLGCEDLEITFCLTGSALRSTSMSG